MPRSLPLFLQRVSLAAVLGFLFVTTAAADNWPQWRGPTFNGISTETNLPVEWNPTKNVAWKLKLPGPAGASPVVWGERIFVTSVAGDEKNELVLICVSTSGKELWRRTVGTGNRRVRRDEGNMASP
ncbi:MAG: PQQ-binding-like beta-propeller repeat protein, partial [Planctomycetes bacterium]|nr:PQQ-binding-like beta-propeller repeat protein [Planctomycetota bacterium]